jgi:KamA family protein
VLTSTQKNRYIRDISLVDEIPPPLREKLQKVTQRYAFRANEYYLGLIDWSDPNDPIRNLIIPNEREMENWGALDASNEAANVKAKGVQHKYDATVLLLCNEVCGAYCRYCFRKRLFMADNAEVNLDVSEGLHYISENPRVTNVLLTGGDPLLMSTRRLRYIIDRLCRIPHVKIIRIGSKMLAFDPWRVLNDPDLTDLFAHVKDRGKRIYLMAHYDHPRELTEPSVEALNRCQDSGAILCNQCPIIKGVNDSAETLAELFRLLSFIGCPPYYIFQGRPTAGNEPYEVPITRGYQLVQDATRHLSGLAARVRFCMSHATGKIEINGVDEDHIYLRYHRAKDSTMVGKILVFHRDDDAYWLDQLRPANEYTSNVCKPYCRDN